MSIVVKLNPVGLDFYIRKLQEKLYTKLTTKWGAGIRYDCYGRAERVKSQDGYQARVCKANKEYASVYLDDAAHEVVSFFGVSTQTDIDEGSVAKVHLVFFSNIAFKSDSKRNDEEIRKDVYEILQSDPYGFRISEQKVGIENCLAEYPGSIRDDRLKFFDTHPHHVFRFDLTVRYDLGAEYTQVEFDPSDSSGGSPGGSGGSGGSGDGGNVQVGESSTDPTEYQNLKYWDIPITNATGSIFRIGASKDFYVNWGSGVRKYTGNLIQLAASSFTSDSATIRVYVANDETDLYIKALKHTIGTITGLILPSTLQVLDMSRDYSFTSASVWDWLLWDTTFPKGFTNVSNSTATTPGLSALPLSLIPSSIRFIDVSHNSLGASAQDDLVAFCAALNATVSLTIGLQKPKALPGNMVAVQQLVDAGSTVIINQGLGGSGYGLFRIESFEASTEMSVPVDYNLTHQISLSSVGNSAVSIGTVFPCCIDWGNGKIYSYPASSMIRCQYLSETDIEIKVYSNETNPLNILQRIYVEGVLGQAVNLDNINQVADADYINISNINLTVSDLSPVIANKGWVRVESNLSVSDVNDVLDIADATPGEVFLMIRQTPPAVPTNTVALSHFQQPLILHD